MDSSGSMPRLDVSDGARGTLYASANAAGMGNGTSDTSDWRRQCRRQKLLGRLARWQRNGILEGSLLEDHDFLNKDLVRNYSVDDVEQFYDHYRKRKTTLMYTELLSSTFRETVSTAESYLVKQCDYRAVKGVADRIEDDFEHYHDEFEEYAESCADLDMPMYVLSGLRLVKTIAGVIAANHSLADKETMPRRIRNAIERNPNIQREIQNTYLDVLTGVPPPPSAAPRASQLAAAQYEDSIAVANDAAANSQPTQMSRMSLAQRTLARREADQALRDQMTVQPPPNGPRPPPPIDTRNLDISDYPAIEEANAAAGFVRPPMKGITGMGSTSMEEDLSAFESQVDIDGVFAAARNNTASLDFSLMDGPAAKRART